MSDALERVSVRCDTPLRLLVVWLAGGLGLLGTSAMLTGSPAGAVMLALGVGAGCASRHLDEVRVVDAKSRTIWRVERCFDAERVEPLARFDECRALRVVRQLTLQDGRDNHRFGLEIAMTDGRIFILADDVSAEEAGQVARLLSLSAERA